MYSRAELYSICISTHTPLARRDWGPIEVRQRLKIFLLTRLLRGVTLAADFRAEGYDISTHTPLARRDLADNGKDVNAANFYSHASCEA